MIKFFPKKTTNRQVMAAGGFAAVGLIVLPWLMKPGYLFFMDFIWGPTSAVDWWRNGLLERLFMKTVGFAFGPAMGEKLLITSVLALVWVAGWRWGHRLTQSRSAAFLTALFCLFNPMVYDRMGYGQFGFIAGYACVLLLAERFADSPWRPGVRSFVAVGLLWGFAIQFSPHYLYIGGVAVILGLAWQWRAGRAVTPSWLTGISAMLAAALVLNVNWLLLKRLVGSATGSVVPVFGQADYAAFQTAGQSGLEATLNVIMLSGFWGKEQMRYFDLADMSGNWGRSFLCLLPILLLGAWSAWRERRRRPVVVAGVIGAVAVVALAVGMRLGPTRWLSETMFRHAPFYSGLRETQKWVALLAVLYAAALALGVRELLGHRHVRPHAATVVTVVAIVVVMQAPLLIWGMGGQKRSVEYPAAWAAVDAELVEAGCPGETLFLPWHMYAGFSWAHTVMAVPANHYFHCPVLKGTNMEWGGIYDNSGSVQGAAVRRWLDSRAPADLEKVGIGHVILAEEGDYRSYGWLDEMPYLDVEIDGDGIRLYRFNGVTD